MSNPNILDIIPTTTFFPHPQTQGYGLVEIDTNGNPLHEWFQVNYLDVINESYLSIYKSKWPGLLQNERAFVFTDNNKAYIGHVVIEFNATFEYLLKDTLPQPPYEKAAGKGTLAAKDILQRTLQWYTHIIKGVCVSNKLSEDNKNTALRGMLINVVAGIFTKENTIVPQRWPFTSLAAKVLVQTGLSSWGLVTNPAFSTVGFKGFMQDFYADSVNGTMEYVYYPHREIYKREEWMIDEDYLEYLNSTAQWYAGFTMSLQHAPAATRGGNKRRRTRLHKKKKSRKTKRRRGKN